MEQLKELVQVVGLQSINNIKLIDQKSKELKEQRVFELYKGIVKGDFDTDHNALSALYDGQIQKKPVYVILKQKLKQKLLNYVMLLEENEGKYSNYQKAKITCHKLLATSQILLIFGARKTSVKLAKKTLSKATKYDLHEIVIAAARILMDHWAAFSGEATI